MHGARGEATDASRCGPRSRLGSNGFGFVAQSSADAADALGCAGSGMGLWGDGDGLDCVSPALAVRVGAPVLPARSLRTAYRVVLAPYLLTHLLRTYSLLAAHVLLAADCLQLRVDTHVGLRVAQPPPQLPVELRNWSAFTPLRSEPASRQ
jgi:hypothetical protein